MKGRKAPDNTIVGARFSDAELGFENHIITHYVEFSAIDSTIQKLNFAKRFLAERLEGRADKKNFNKPKAIVSYDGYEYKETKIRDMSMIRRKKKLDRTTFKMSHLKTIFMILIFERHFPGKSKTCWQ